MNAEQYNDCVEQHSDALYRFALKNLKDSDDAKEIVQISFEKLWNRRSAVDNERVKSYLFKVAYNAMVDHWRAAKKTTQLSPEMENRATDNTTEYKGLKKIIENAMKQLPDIQKAVIMLRDYEGYSYAEIGEITNLKESQVKVYIFRGRQTLKNILGSLEAVL